MKIAMPVLFSLLPVIFSSHATALTSEEKEQQLRVLDEMITGWVEAKDAWSKDLSRREKEIQDLRSKTDIDARTKTIKDKAESIIKQAPKGIADRLSGKTEKAAITAVKMAKEFRDAKIAEGEIIDIAFDDEKNGDKLASLEKQAFDLKSNIQIANDVIARTSEEITRVQSTVTYIQLPHWIGEALVKASEAQQRVEARREAERKEAERKSNSGQADHIPDRPDRHNRPRSEEQQPDKQQPDKQQPDKPQPDKPQPDKPIPIGPLG